MSRSSLAHRIDDAVYTVERAFVFTSMASMVLMVFFDVVDRRLQAPESKLAALLHFILRPAGFGDPERAPWVAAWLSPAAAAAIAFGLLWFGLATVRRRRERSLVPIALEPVLAIGATGALWALCWLMIHRPSNDFYAVVWLIAGGAVAADQRRRGKVALALTIAATTVGALGLKAIVPEGYSWAKEVAMILLVWTGLIGASMAAHQGRHIDIDVGRKLFPTRFKTQLTALAHLVTVGFCGLIVYLGLIYVFGPTGLYTLEGRFPHTGIPDWIVGLSIPWSFAMIALRTVLLIRRVWSGEVDAKGSSPSAVAAGIGHGAPPAAASSTEAGS
jgi:TRAP-type C4-dicarboxylate transport system permease small subunit